MKWQKFVCGTFVDVKERVKSFKKGCKICVSDIYTQHEMEYDLFICNRNQSSEKMLSECTEDVRILFFHLAIELEDILKQKLGFERGMR